jgi:hypothetical protein
LSGPEIAAQKASGVVTTRFLVSDYALRDSIAVDRCECRLLDRRSNMTRSEPSALLASAAVKSRGPHDERSACLACGARIDSSESTIKIGGALVHMRCAVQRRRVARR